MGSYVPFDSSQSAAGFWGGGGEDERRGERGEWRRGENERKKERKKKHQGCHGRAITARIKYLQVTQKCSDKGKVGEKKGYV